MIQSTPPARRGAAGVAFALTAVALLSPARGAFAQEPVAAEPVKPAVAPAKPAVAAPAVPAQDGASLFAATLQAHGGEAFLKMKSLRVSGSGVFSGAQQAGGFPVPIDSVTLLAVSPDRSLLDADTGLGRLRVAALGGKKGGWQAFGGNVRDLKPEQSSSVDPLAFVRQVAGKKLPAKLLTTITPEVKVAAGGKALEAFEIVGEGGVVNRVWVEADTKLVRRLSSKTARGEGATLLSDYREVDGVKLPTKVVFLQNGNELFSLTFNTVEVNVDVPKNAFDKPKAEKPAEAAGGSGN